MSRRSSCPPFASIFPRASARSATSPMRPRCWSSSIRAILNPWRRSGRRCPDHFLRTKIRPLVLPYDPISRNLDAVIAALDKTLADYRADYAAYYQRCKHAEFAGDARPQRGHLSRPRRRHAVLRQGQIDGSHRRGILRQRDQRDAWLDERRPLCRAFGAGSVQYRILVAGRGQAPAHAEAEIARRARRAGDRRRGRHRAGDRGSAHGRRRLRRARRHRRPEPGRGRRRLRQAVRQGCGQRRSRRCDQRGQGRRRVPRGAARFWRAGHPRRQRRHRLRRAVRGHLARALEPQYRDPRDRIFPVRARAATAS